ncbi:MAG: hypothetical protein A2176_13415 [Spirochaetes bacterium RBG_13_51_14]|nr:MAG: hypothetical protein A2176_13415 [Spirochaetes bacterium RBG_13_51_14]
MKTVTPYIGLISAFLIMAAHLHCSKDDGTISKNTYGIILKGYTEVRIDPMIFAGIIMDLKKGESVQVLERSSEKSWVGKDHDFWYRIKTRDGLPGWVFGQNISIHSSGGGDSIDKIVSDFMEVERAEIQQFLAGKWWSTNEFGDFTEHCLEFYESGAYKSYLKGNDNSPIIGRYKLDFDRNEIIFSGGTSFQSNLDLVKRGNEYVIKKDMKDYELRFTRISIETSPEPEITVSEKRKSRSGNGNKAE